MLGFELSCSVEDCSRCCRAMPALSGTPHPGMPQVVLKKTEEAIADSDIVLFVVDARQGVTEADRHYARYTLVW